MANEYIGGEMRLMVAPLSTITAADAKGDFVLSEFMAGETELKEIADFTELTTADPSRPERRIQLGSGLKLRPGIITPASQTFDIWEPRDDARDLTTGYGILLAAFGDKKTPATGVWGKQLWEDGSGRYFTSHLGNAAERGIAADDLKVMNIIFYLDQVLKIAKT